MKHRKSYLVVFSFLMAAMMAGSISLAMTWVTHPGSEWLSVWLASYALAFAIAWPLSLIITPVISRLSVLILSATDRRRP